MTEPYGYDDENDTDDNDSEGHVTLKRSQIRAMERDAKQARKAQEELAEARREIAFAKAGVGDLTERQRKALFASIDGDITADAVREAALDLGFSSPPADSPQDRERQQMEQMSKASAGAQDPDSEDSIARLHRADREGGREAVLAEIQRSGIAQIVQ